MASFPGLPRDLPAYLADLAANNSRDWFEAHREPYKTLWLGPGLDLVAALAPLAAEMEPPLKAVPKLNGSLRRINRDTRFAADKRPYEPHLHLILSTGTAFNRAPGFHIVLSPQGLGWGAGVWGLEPAALARMRRRICDAPDRTRLLKAIDAAATTGSRLDEPDLVRVPAGFTAEPAWAHLLRRHHMVLRTQEPLPMPAWLFTPEAPDRFAGLAQAHLPLLAWLASD